MVPFDLTDEPLPERKGFGMRIVHAKDMYPLFKPVQDHVFELLKQGLPSVGLEIEGIDVLVFLRRILGELNSPVGTPAEPGWISLHIGMIRRALEGNIQGHFHPSFMDRADQSLEILKRPKLGVYRLVPAFLCPDGPGASGILGSGDEGVVFTLAIGSSNRMDRGQIDHIETHVGDVGEPVFQISEVAVPSWLISARPRKQLVTG